MTRQTLDRLDRIVWHPRAMLAVLAVLVSIELAMVACATKTYVVHPGSVSRFDSQAYDTLLTAQAAIDAAKADYAAGKLPEASKPLLNEAIRVYNVAEAAWHTYHDTAAAAQAGNTAQLQGELQGDLDQLAAAIAAFETSLGKKPAPAGSAEFIKHDATMGAASATA